MSLNQMKSQFGELKEKYNFLYRQWKELKDIISPLEDQMKLYRSAMKDLDYDIALEERRIILETINPNKVNKHAAIKDSKASEILKILAETGMTMQELKELIG